MADSPRSSLKNSYYISSDALTLGIGERRPKLRFFAYEEDLSHEVPDTPLSNTVVSSAEPFLLSDGHRRRPE